MQHNKKTQIIMNFFQFYENKFIAFIILWLLHMILMLLCHLRLFSPFRPSVYCNEKFMF